MVAKILQAYDDWDANQIIVEVNNGGEWIPNSILSECRHTNHATPAVESIRAKKHLAAGPVAFDFKAFKEEQYDLLASTVETSIDMEKIMEIIGATEK